MKSYIAHYMNKYPGGVVDSDGEMYLRAYDASGRLRVVLANAAGSCVDRGAMSGAMDKHDLSPIPKDCRVWCDRVNGLEQHQEAKARLEIAMEVAENFDGRVPSVEEICGADFNGSNKFVDDFRAQQWIEKGSVVAVQGPKIEAPKKAKSLKFKDTKKK